MKVYVYRNPSECSYPFAEVLNGKPVHAGDLRERVRSLIEEGLYWATCSDTVLSILGWMVRKGELKVPLHIIHVDANGETMAIRFDIKGDFIEPWPEIGFESILDAGFHYRYD